MVEFRLASNLINLWKLWKHKRKGEEHRRAYSNCPFLALLRAHKNSRYKYIYIFGKYTYIQSDDIFIVLTILDGLPSGLEQTEHAIIHNNFETSTWLAPKILIYKIKPLWKPPSNFERCLRTARNFLLFNDW